jgi:uncharacterized membrane protein
MRRHVSKRIRFLRTTLIGGLIFLLPLIIIGVALGHVARVVLAVAAFLRETLGIETAFGYGTVVAIAVAGVILICFAAGMAARWTIGKRLMGFVESRLTMIFPRYAIYKDQLAGGIGGEFAQGQLKPVLATLPDGTARLALEVERSADGVVAIYLPSAPDSWSGSVVFLPAERVSPVAAEFGEVMATFEKLGRNSLHVSGIARTMLAPETSCSPSIPERAVLAPAGDGEVRATLEE